MGLSLRDVNSKDDRNLCAEEMVAEEASGEEMTR